jgi:hypothetical protein
MHQAGLEIELADDSLALVCRSLALQSDDVTRRRPRACY